METTTSNSTTQDERRARMIERVRKLLAMANDGRGNTTEEETALRQANKIMAQFAIDEAEVQAADLKHGRMSFGEVFAGMDGQPLRPGVVFPRYSEFVGVTALGVAKFCDCITTRMINENGQVMRFRGEKNDVLMARWLLGALIQSIERALAGSGWSSTRGADAFKRSAALVLQRRLYEMAQERAQMIKEAPTGTALIVLDQKALKVAELFGKQGIKKAGGGNGNMGARIAGQQAGQRINIPSNRPLDAPAARARLN